MLRANEVIEVYRIINNQMVLLTKYESFSAKIAKIIVVRKPGTNIDLLVLDLPKLKFVTLELDREIFEFKILCLHNFENDRRL